MEIYFMSSKDSKDSKDSKNSKDFKDFKDSKDSNETFTMHTKSNNIKIMVGNETDEIIKELFDSLLQRYQEELEELMKGSRFFFW